MICLPKQQKAVAQKLVEGRMLIVGYLNDPLVLRFDNMSHVIKTGFRATPVGKTPDVSKENHDVGSVAGYFTCPRGKRKIDILGVHAPPA